MKTTFTFTVLRYVHDVSTGEFVNMGIALYAPEANYLSAICNSRYGRLSRVFLNVNGEHVRSLMHFVQSRFEELGAKLAEELPLDGKPKSIMEIAGSVLPPDDSSLQWAEPGGGITEDPATGGASGPLGCYLLHHHVVTPEAARNILSLQGVAMLRPSRIHISIDSTDGTITRVRVGGRSVMVGRGELLL